MQAKAFMDEERELKRAIKSDAEDLHSQTKSTIESLSDEQIHLLLRCKWIDPLIKELNKLPTNVVESLASKIQGLAAKYSVTLSQIEEEITETEKTLTTMLDDLTGSVADMQGIAELRALLGGI